jgi:hypothetical protein
LQICEESILPNLYKYLYCMSCLVYFANILQNNRLKMTVKNLSWQKISAKH